jgi:hypothetical protein
MKPHPPMSVAAFRAEIAKRRSRLDAVKVVKRYPAAETALKAKGK